MNVLNSNGKNPNTINSKIKVHKDTMTNLKQRILPKPQMFFVCFFFLTKSRMSEQTISL